MEQVKYTPGPWTYIRNPENTRWIIDCAPSHAIACTAGYEPDNEANARLIAAAPELLEALESILFEDSDKSEIDRIKDRVKARSALAKAKGGAA